MVMKGYGRHPFEKPSKTDEQKRKDGVGEDWPASFRKTEQDRRTKAERWGWRGRWWNKTIPTNHESVKIASGYGRHPFEKPSKTDEQKRKDGVGEDDEGLWPASFRKTEQDRRTKAERWGWRGRWWNKTIPTNHESVKIASVSGDHQLKRAKTGLLK
ncbi:hypothetical protein QE152_g29277 [Popillia japonica]|uniref:Uncharacterized protein n=1 Tax=Popillia japonica TaxID=7064 RepID=A0AAW1JIC8_POPJA